MVETVIRQLRKPGDRRAGRITGCWWLSDTHQPGDTESCTQAEALVLAAEARTGLRSKRRTDLLLKRIQGYEQQLAGIRNHHETQAQALHKVKDHLSAAVKKPLQPLKNGW